MKLEGKIVLLTGAGSGIGRALAQALNAKGARLILVGRRLDALEETLSLLPNREGSSAVSTDITNPESRERLHDTVLKSHGRLDVLINNAGMVGVELFDHTKDKDIEAMVTTNLTAPMVLTRDLLGLLVKGAPSRVVNIGSMFGDIAFPYFAVYSATKFGMRGFSDGLRRELSPLGIGVTYCAPRATKTPAATTFNHLAVPFAMKFDSPEKVASAIVRGIEKEKRSVYPMGPERFFVLVQRLFPALVDKNLTEQFLTARTLKKH